MKGVVSCEVITPGAGKQLAVEKDPLHSDQRDMDTSDAPQAPDGRRGKKRRRQSKGEASKKRTKLLPNEES